MPSLPSAARPPARSVIRHPLQTQISIGGSRYLATKKAAEEEVAVARPVNSLLFGHSLTHSLSWPDRERAKGVERRASGKSITPACVVRSFGLVTQVQKASSD